MKKCKGCNQIKKLSEFYKHEETKDGYLNLCKDCVKEKVRVYRNNNIEHIRKNDRDRHATEEENKRQRNYRSSRIITPEQRERKRLAIYNLRAKDKRIGKAYNFVARNLQDEKPKICSICGRIKETEAHHLDYGKPDYVIWCCSKCHKAFHPRQLKSIIS